MPEVAVILLLPMVTLSKLERIAQLGQMVPVHRSPDSQKRMTLLMAVALLR
jgi:hypothetical protein